MRIGILTLPLHSNYGGILQAYALQTVLERMGHDVKVIDLETKGPKPFPTWKLPLVYTKRLVLKFLFGKNIRIFLEKYERKFGPIMCQFTYNFIDKYIHQVSFDKVNDLSKEKFDVYIVGSDQVWRPCYFGEIEHAFLDFTNNQDVLRISYAASFGVDTWEYTKTQTENCRRLIQKFKAVSVREKSGIYLCEKYLYHSAEWVLDPTMLLDKEDYINLIKAKNTPKSEGNLLFYLLDENPSIMDLVHHISEEKKMIPFRVGSKVNDRTAPLEERIQPPLEEWLRGFYDADFVVTDSFHACVFSIIFRKQFIVVGNRKRGMSRFESLLEMFGLEDCLYDVNSHNISYSKINFDEVHEKLNVLHEHSMNFLKKALND